MRFPLARAVITQAMMTVLPSAPNGTTAITGQLTNIISLSSPGLQIISIVPSTGGLMMRKRSRI